MSETTRGLADARAERPDSFGRALGARRRPEQLLGENGRLLVIAADHPARGALGAGDRPYALADRGELLDRICLALSRPGVRGFLGTPDLVEDLTLLGVLDDKVVLGSMNRGGLAGASFEIDDRFTAYDAPGIAAARLEGGKMLLRIDLDDSATAATLEACAQAVSALAERRLLALVEPFMSTRREGRVHNVLTADAMTRAVAIASGLGTTSAWTWLKVPVVEDLERVAAATTLPLLLLGGEVAADHDETLARWRVALKLPTVRGLVVGRALLFPPDDDVQGAVDRAVELVS
jgi:hypothetical protein